jgi:hypothetical protein
MIIYQTETDAFTDKVTKQDIETHIRANDELADEAIILRDWIACDGIPHDAKFIGADTVIDADVYIWQGLDEQE